ncbi:gamma-glutamyltransferase [Halioxenophilus aromaticivorans]|uniref:Glutathione hydrolase proenzyme n=1 Tax=Halioxenophilus aromaticivorans TaxID=1306992 RepID=A0AAV3U2J4_9ALTE
MLARPFRSISLVVGCSFFVASCGTQLQQTETSHSFSNAQPTGLVAEHAAVVSARQEVSDIGLAVLQNGGNAFDAMVAVEMALAVAYPFAGSPGGGGFVVYRQANGDVGALDFREKAPAAAHRDMYLDENGDVINGMSRDGATAVGVPGTIAGIFAINEKLGTKPMAELLQPVIELAEQGVVVTPYQAGRLADSREKITSISGPSSKFSQAYSAGDVIKRPHLAQTLRKLASGGRDEFYKGETAKKIARFIQVNGGYITEQDLANYQVAWREPVQFSYKGLDIISMSPPSSGGITLQQIMAMIEPFNVGQYDHNSLPVVQVLTEAERRAYADRNHFLGDPDFVEIPYTQLTGSNYLSQRMASFSFDTATKSSDVAHGAIEVVESNETTHYSIVDQYGNAVAATITINGAYGSKLYSDELGFFFNNEMDDFSAKPGVPNMFGLTGSEANSIAAGKRMLSSMTPTIALKDGELFMVLGAPGGSTIITSVLQTLINVYEFGYSMQAAVNAPRFHHQWLPDAILFETEGFDPALMPQLEAKGYNVMQGRSPVIGKVDAILRLDDGRLETGADKRGDDAAAVY